METARSRELLSYSTKSAFHCQTHRHCSLNRTRMINNAMGSIKAENRKIILSIYKSHKNTRINVNKIRKTKEQENLKDWGRNEIFEREMKQKEFLFRISQAKKSLNQEEENYEIIRLENSIQACRDKAKILREERIKSKKNLLHRDRLNHCYKIMEQNLSNEISRKIKYSEEKNWKSNLLLEKLKGYSDKKLELNGLLRSKKTLRSKVKNILVNDEGCNRHINHEAKFGTTLKGRQISARRQSAGFEEKNIKLVPDELLVNNFSIEELKFVIHDYISR